MQRTNEKKAYLMLGSKNDVPERIEKKEPSKTVSHCQRRIDPNPKIRITGNSLPPLLSRIS